MGRIGFVSLEDTITNWPEDLCDLPDFLDQVGISNFEITQTDEQISMTGKLLWLTDLRFSVPGLDSLSIAVMYQDGITEVPFAVNILPTFSLTIPEITLSLIFNSDLLKPVQLVGGKWTVITDGGNQPVPVELEFSGVGFSVDLQTGFSIVMPDGAPGLSLAPVMIGDSGVVIELNDVKPYFSSAQELPDDLPDGFIGVYADSATLYLPDSIDIPLVPDQLDFTGLAIGSTGFSATITGSWEVGINGDGSAFTGDTAGSILGIPFALKALSLDIQQNVLTGSQLSGLIILPFFDQPLSCELSLTNDGDFTLAISAEQDLPDGITAPTSEDGLFVFTREDLLTLKLQSIAFVKQDGVLSIELSGSVKPLLLADQIEWPEFEIKKLSIGSDGSVKIDGGWLEMSGQQALDFHGFQIEITKLGFGNEEDGSKWVGFSGGVQLVEGLPLKGGVEGLKLIWGNGSPRLEISGINVAFEIENTLSFDGRVYFIDEPDNKGFKGAIKLTLPPLSGLMIDGQFMAGVVSAAPAYKYAYVYLGVELPVGIPLGSTGASLYGLAGLVGYNSTMDKRDSEAWYENDDGSDGFYKRGTPGVTSVDKWTNARDALAFGAGVTLGTSPDNGFTFTGKVLLVVLIPGPVIIIEGRASFLTERSKGTEDPLFTLLAVLDPAAGTYLFNVGANYKLDQSKGLVIDLKGTAEAFFDANNPSAWHFYIGKDTPESKRIQATVLTLFQASAYFMIDKDGLVLGGKAGYDKTYKFSVLKVVLQAYIEGRLEFSIKPIHAMANVLLLGNVELSACGVSLGLSISAYLEVQTPTPWLIFAQLKVKLNLPWPLPDPSATITLEWKEESEPPLPLALATLGMEHHKTTETWPLTIHPDFDTDDDGFQDSSSTSEPSDACSSSPLVPPDGKPVIGFSKPMKDAYAIGSSGSAAPSAEVVGDYEYKYELKKITLECKEKTGTASWVTVSEAGAEADSYDATLYGQWQAIEGEGSTNVKLMLWVNTPYELSRNLQDNRGIVFGLQNYWRSYPCAEVTAARKICITFDDIINRQYWYYLLKDQVIFASQYLPMDILEYAGGWAGVDSALVFGKGGSLVSATYCADIPALRTGLRKNTLESNKVVFKAGYRADGASYYPLVTQDRFVVDGKTEIAVGSSTNKAGFARIEFPAGDFPQAPDFVTVTCGHGANLLNLYAFDDARALLDNSSHSAGAHQVQTLTLTGDGIRSIDIEGSEIAILEVCYGFRPDKDDITRLRIIFPENVSEVQLFISMRSAGTYAVHDEDATRLDSQPYAITANRPLTIGLEDAAPFRFVDLYGNFKLLKVCYVTAQAAADAAYNQQLVTSISASLNETWSHSANVLEPDKYYRLTVSTVTRRRKNSGDWSDHEFSEHAYFQTGNPPGAFDAGSHDDDGAYPYGGALADLTPYVATTIPAQVATNARTWPTYRCYDAGIEFNESQGYVEQLYLQADLQLKIRLFDNNDQPLLDADGAVIEFDNAWGDNPVTSLTREEEQWLQTLNRSDCELDTSSLGLEATTSLVAGADGMVLNPRSTYVARLYAGSEYVAYRFSFLTSRYCHFIDHVHSFIDKAWSHHAVSGSPEQALLDSDGITGLEAVLTGFTKRQQHTPATYAAESEQVGFEQLVTLFELDNRQLPEQVEVLLLDDSSTWYGLLLESPEPIAWERTSLAMSYLSRGEVLEECAGSIKLLDLQVGSGTAGEENGEYVDILLRESVDLDGCTLTVRHADEEEASTVYSFGSGTIPAGRILRIHSGAEQDVGLAAGYSAYFAGDEAASFLYRNGDTITLLDADGTPIHTRSFSDSFTAKQSVCIRNADQTRAFLFVAQGASKYAGLREGAWRISFTFQRDIGAAATVLKLNGDSSDENTFLEFDLPALLPD